MQPILKIDLSTGKTEEYKIPEEWEQAFLGGASLAARLLYPYLTKELDPFSPEAPLLFINGRSRAHPAQQWVALLCVAKARRLCNGPSQIAAGSGGPNCASPDTMVCG
ncbi:MAG: hypothetical protein HY258_01290 [Chloroflexi bacterium]|nr:hypothetical protein [Chloroflexota bacterium]